MAKAIILTMKAAMDSTSGGILNMKEYYRILTYIEKPQFIDDAQLMRTIQMILSASGIRRKTKRKQLYLNLITPVSHHDPNLYLYNHSTIRPSDH
jgi:hypothetical protein